MTSTDIVRSEIRRFLRSPDPEVICVTGDWGVGKTSALVRLRTEKPPEILQPQGATADIALCHSITSSARNRR